MRRHRRSAIGILRSKAVSRAVLCPIKLAAIVEVNGTTERLDNDLAASWDPNII